MREKTIEREKVNFFKNLGAMFWTSEPEEKGQNEEIETYRDEPEDSKKLWRQALKNVANMEKMVEVPTKKSQKRPDVTVTKNSASKVTSKKKEQTKSTIVRDTESEEQDRMR